MRLVITLAGAVMASACGGSMHSASTRKVIDTTLGLYAGVLETSKEIPLDVKIKAAQIGVYVGEAFEQEKNICTYYYTLETLKDFDIYDLTKAATYLQDGLRMICDLPENRGIERNYSEE